MSKGPGMIFPQVFLAIESVAIRLNISALAETPKMVTRIGELTIMFSIILFSPKLPPIINITVTQTKPIANLLLGVKKNSDEQII